MDTLRSPIDTTPEKPSLVVALNNMVFYGEFVPNDHIVVVIDEEYADPGEIPERFLQLASNEQPDWFPIRSTTAGPEIQISVVQSVNVTDQNEVTSSPYVETTSVRNEEDNVMQNRSRSNPERVLDMQFFSDVDGANK